MVSHILTKQTKKSLSTDSPVGTTVERGRERHTKHREEMTAVTSKMSRAK